MRAIWYLLKCPEGYEADYTKRCPELVAPQELMEVVCFKYQRMMRYGGKWHLENRMLLPGYIFLSGTEVMATNGDYKESKGGKERSPSVLVPLIPCGIPYAREMCQKGDLVGLSKGIIRNGKPIVTSGPLKGREGLIRKIDRHKRTAEIEIPFVGDKKQVTVGLEIYEKHL